MLNNARNRKRIFRIRRPLCIVSLVIMAFIYIVTGGCAPVPMWDVDGYSGKEIVVIGKVTERQIKNNSLKLFINNVQTVKPDGKVIDTDIEGLVVNISDTSMEQYTKLGSLIEAAGVFAAFDIPYNDGEFNSRSYYKIRGYDGQVKKARLKGVSRDYNILKESLRIFRNQSEEIIYRYMSTEYAATLSAMLLGDKTSLDTDIKELYQNAGISHILALSGLHIATIGLAFLKLLRKALPSSVAAGTSSVIIVIYCIMTGMSTSAIRAVIMFLMGVLAMSIGRTYDLITAASFSAICILLERPGYLYDASFLLSFMAIAGIGLVYPLLYEITSPGRCKLADNSGKSNRLISRRHILIIIGKIRQSMCVSMSITLSTLPITAYSFFQISKYSILLNIVVIPLMSIVLAFGGGGIALGLIAMALGHKLIYMDMLFEYTCRMAFALIQEILGFFNIISGTAAGFRDNLIILGRPGSKQCIIYYIGILSLVILYKKTAVNGIDLLGLQNKVQTRRIIGFKGPGAEKHKKMETVPKRATSNCTDWIKSIVLSTIYISSLCVILCWHSMKKMEIRNIYVGQGDCALICGGDIPTIMIDGGSSDLKQVGKYKMLPVIKSNKLNKIDYCFLTHMDKDHINGVLEIMENYSNGVEIKNIVVSESYINMCEEYISKGEEKTEDILDVYLRLMKLQEDGRTKLLLMKSGDEMRFGELLISCLSPEASYIYDGNDSSLVLMLVMENINTYDKFPVMNLITGKDTGGKEFRALFTGDISSETEERIKNKLTEVDYLKVAHHGSRYSTSDDFLSYTNPKLAVVSAGVNNSYGHPHEETIVRLGKYIKAPLILRTDEGGQITVKMDRGNLYVGRFLDY